MGHILSRPQQWLTPYVLNPAKPSASHKIPNWNTHDDFFRYTSGRWLFNEAKQLASRCVRFDMNELARIAAESVGSRSCRMVEKYQEGQCNKIFLMKTEEGKEVIAKVPQPNAGRPHFTTASEVATMDYVRNVLQVPVPEIYAWNSEASTNSVGAEYIIMEKAPGVELSRVWPELRGDERGKILKQIIQFQKRFTASPFPSLGSLYYADSLDKSLKAFPVERGALESVPHPKDFVVGPINDERFFEEGRGDIECDRGPWSCTQDYLVALGLHELSYVKSGKKPQPLGIFGGPSWYMPSIAGKLAVLEDYLKIARYLPPKKDPSGTAAILWHDDLHSGNIFVHPDDSTRITCIIDWQSSPILPLIRHVIRPEFLDFEGPKPPLGFDGDARKLPQLPANYKELSRDERKDAEALVRQQSLYKFFEILSAKQNRSVSAALLHQESPRCQLIDYAAITGYHMEPQVKAHLIEAADAWEQIVGSDGPPCPLHYSEEDRKIAAEELTNWSDCCALLDHVRGDLGVPNAWNGAVSSEEYDETRTKLRKIREDFLDLMANDEEERMQWARVWPYDDDQVVKE